MYKSSSCENINNKNLNNFLRLLNSMSYSHLLIFGDINCSTIDCVNMTTNRGPGDINYEFLETIRDCFLHQHITEPTRGRGDAKLSTLDVLFSNEEGMVTDVNVAPPLGKSDHSVINFKFNGYHANSNCDKTRYKYDKADYVNMKKYLNIDWDMLLTDLSVEDQWTIFESKIHDEVDTWIPKVKVKVDNVYKNSNNVCPLGMKAQSKNNKKQKLWNKLRAKPDEIIRKEYNRIRNEIRRLSRKL